MAEPRICVLVLNWNGAADTIECVRSLNLLSYNNADVVVIDNGSTDDSVKRLQAEFSDLTIIELDTNLFFGGGNNAGLEYASKQGYDYVIFLNNDTTVEADFIEPLLHVFEDSGKVGMAAPLMCYYATPDLVWYGGGKVNLWTGSVQHLHIRKDISTIEIEPTTTDYITGCCLMMPTQLAQELGGFHLAFKMYGEDVDLSLRTRAAGYDLVFVPASKIHHKVSASVGGEFSLRKMKRKMFGLLRLYLTHAKPYQYVTIALSQGVVLARQLIQLLFRRLINQRHHTTMLGIKL